MMFKYYFLLLLMGHILGDYYFQTNKLVEQKESEKLAKVIIYNIKHGLIYLISVVVVLLPVFKSIYIIPVILLVFIHFIVDLLKSIIIKSYNKTTKNIFKKVRDFYVWVFIADQTIHIITIVCFAIYFENTVLLEKGMLVEKLESIINISYYDVILVVFIILLNGKYFNIFIKKVFYKFQPSEDIETNSVKGAGGIIGFIERLLIALLYYNNQFAIIGLVITAKSVARYNKVTEDAKFAEYYLMGTLSSTLFSILSVYFINWVK